MDDALDLHRWLRRTEKLNRIADALVAAGDLVQTARQQLIAELEVTAPAPLPEAWRGQTIGEIVDVLIAPNDATAGLRRELDRMMLETGEIQSELANAMALLLKERGPR
jgi:hypothetical protein